MQIDLGRVENLTRRLIDISTTLDCNPRRDKTGGVLTLALCGFSQGHLIDFEGYPKEKVDKYFSISQEKAHRLYAHWLRNHDVALSSWQTRDPAQEMWGGAVLFQNASGSPRLPYIVSFSGLAEVTDEALSLVLGYDLGFTQDRGYLARIAGISQNPVFNDLFKASRPSP